MSFYNLQILKHSLKTPLTNLLVKLDLLSNQSQSKETQQIISSLKQTVRYLERIFNFFIDKNKREKTSELIKLLQEIQIFHHQGKKLLIRNYTQGNDTILLNCNKFLLQEALICLINNAFESYQNQINEKVLISIYQGNSFIEIRLRDYGQGMSLFKKLRINLKNKSYKKNHQAIGLKFAKNVFIKDLKAIFQLYSQKNMGTLIIVRLPINQAITKTASSFNQRRESAKFHPDSTHININRTIS